MALDYESPRRPAQVARVDALRSGQSGCALGAIAFPAVFVVIAVVGNDAGGPCFWPAAPVIGGVLGFVIGTVVGALRQLIRWLGDRSAGS